MAKINILPSKVYNRIAAGEVVDRPYSVVKELVENSIDAGATEIQIHIENGGKQLVRVVDNGCGIERDDLHSAFLPHATSKIAKAEDLENITTLGFRGEAVASIAAVSKMSVSSKTAGGKRYRLSSDGGQLGQIVEDAGEDVGTDVRVEMLFFNTPVRLKFLRSDKAEETEITNFVSRFILNRPDIAFTYYANGKKVLQSFGGSEEEALVCVYGASVLADCFKIDAEKHGIRIRGYIGNQNFYKSNRSYQSVFLNGRYIVNETIASAISSAYSDYLMKRQYPFYVLHITLPTEVVDVNVHPNKANVRFTDNQIVYACIHKVVSDVLDGNKSALDYVVSAREPKPVSEGSVPQSKESEAPKKQTTFGFATLTYEDAQREIEACAPAFTSKKQGLELPFDVSEQPKRKGFIPLEEIEPYEEPSEEELAALKRKRAKKDGAEELHKRFPDLFFERHTMGVEDPAYAQIKKDSEATDGFLQNKKYLEELDRKAKQNKIDVSECVYAGKLFNTYLIYERDQEAYIIDQHAAHERLIFNRLKEQMQNRTVAKQPMLLPYELSVNAFEYEFLRERIEDIRAIGFDISENGSNGFTVSAVPLDLQSIDLRAFFGDILGDIDGYRSVKLVDILKDKLATAACKAAVKGGMDLTREEISALFAMMDGDMGLKCPHGRPVVVKLTRAELEKMFKRIV